MMWLFSCHAVHRFGRRMLIDLWRTHADGLPGIARCGARAGVLTTRVTGTGVRGANAQNDCGKACEDDVSGATLRRILRKQSREAQVPSAAHGYSISAKAHNL
jgi:hypothetical protein